MLDDYVRLLVAVEIATGLKRIIPVLFKCFDSKKQKALSHRIELLT